MPCLIIQSKSFNSLEYCVVTFETVNGSISCHACQHCNVQLWSTTKYSLSMSMLYLSQSHRSVSTKLLFRVNRKPVR